MDTIFLDTDACIEIIRGNPGPIDPYSGARFVISSITRFEIRSGLRKRKSPKLEARAEEFLQTVEVLPFDADAADSAAALRGGLESKGTPIGAYDLLLAGHAMAEGFPFLTGNVAEFKRVRGLNLLSWR